MRVERILGEIWTRCRDQIHVVRVAAVLAAVEGLLRVARLSVTAVGRGIVNGARPKHGIKRIDRLLSNPHLYRDRRTVFSAIAAQLLVGIDRPVILVDWTDLVGGFQGLVAAVPFSGRALPIYAEVHEKKLLGNSRIEAQFLQMLKSLLPLGCRPIVVTNAGFRGPQFCSVTALGWDFVGRLRGSVSMRDADGQVTSKAALYREARSIPRDRGLFRLFLSRRTARERPVSARLVLFHKNRRLRPRATHSPLTSRAKRKAAQGAREPWLLATSLTAASAAAVVGIYRKRMQIEETFRDTKNHRWGWSLRDARCTHAHRLATLLLVASLAMLAATLLGQAAERQGIHRHYQANTSRQRVLSLFVLALQILARNDLRRLNTTAILAGVHTIRSALTSGMQP